MNALRRARRHIRLARQRGIAGLVALMFIMIIAFFAMSQTASISASSLVDSSRQLDSVEAIFLAESAIEHVGHRFVASGATPTCDDATVGAGEAPVTLGRGTFKVIGAYTTQFDGTTALSSSKLCRVRVQAEVTSTKVTRTLDVIVGTDADVISISSLNPNFNLNVFEGDRADDDVNIPVNWALTSNAAGSGSMAFVAWDHTGGNSNDNLTCKTTGVDCDRAAFIRKSDTGTGTASAGGAFNTSGTPIWIKAPKTLRLTFDFRVWARTGGGGGANYMFFSPRLVFDTGSVEATGAAGGDCDASSNAGWCESPNTSPGSPAWKGSYGKGCGMIDTVCYESGQADATLCPGYDPDTSYNGPTGVATGTAGTYAECVGDGHSPPIGTSGYRTGYLTYVVPCTGTCLSTGEVQLTSISFTRSDGGSGFSGKPGAVVWVWVDNLRLSVPSLSGGGPAKMWREVATP